MNQYAVIVDGRVRAVAETSGVPSPDEVYPLSSDHSVHPGMLYDEATDTFSDPPSAPVLTVTLDATEVTPGTTVTGTVEVRQDGTLVNISGTYHVPVFDVDGRKATMLRVTVSGGQGTKAFSLSDEGIYTLRTDLIRPKPTAQMAESPELVVAS